MKNTFYRIVILAALSVIGSRNLIYGQATPQQATPLQNGDKVLFLGNSFTEWNGPLPGDIQSLIKASGSGLNVTFTMKVKGLGIFKEYATWTSKGFIDEIRKGGYKYVVLQGWYDAINRMDSGTLENGSPNPLPYIGYPQCQDTMLKYFKILDQEIKNVGAKTILYEPHVGAPLYSADKATSHETYAKLKYAVSCFHAPVIWAWDSVRVRYPTTNYSCTNHTPGSFIDLLYNPNDCGHQNGDGILLDALTFYTIFTQRSGETLKPVLSNGPMLYPDKYEEYAKIGYNTGKSILALNNSGFTDAVAPSVPGNLNATNILTNSFILNWTASTDNIGVLGYRVYKDNVLIGTTATPKLAVSGLFPGTTYMMKIEAFDSESNVSALSTILGILTGIATAIDASGVLMSWDFTGQQGMSSASATYVMPGVSASSPSGFFGVGPKMVPVGTVANIYYASKQTAGSLAAAITNNDYLKFTVTPQPGNKVTIHTVSFSGYSQNQDRNFVLMSSVKGFTAGQEHGSITAKTLSNFTISVSGVDSVDVPVEFRFYIWQPGAANQYETSGIDNLSITGNVKGQPLPAFPTNLTVTGLSETGFTLKWRATLNGELFEVFQNGISIGTTTSLSMNISNVTIDGIYAMTVVSRDGAGNPSDPSDVLSVQIPDLHAPTVPQNLTATGISMEGFNLYWDASSDNVGVTLYEIFRNDTLFGNTAQAYLPVPYLSPGTTYRMKVRAKDAAGNVSATTANITVTTAVFTTPDNDPPSVPLNLTATGISDHSFVLHWDNATDNVGVALYEIYESNTLLGTAVANLLSLTGLSAATTYHVKVRAKDAAGNYSAFSVESDVLTANQVTVPGTTFPGTTLPGTTFPGSGLPDIEAPSVPQNLTATGITAHAFDLHWDNSTDNVGVSSYEIFANNTLIGTTVVNSLSVTGLSANVLYKLKVRAKDSAGNLSAFSAELYVTTSIIISDTETTAIPHEILLHDISINPNPAKNSITIKAHSVGVYNIILYNVYGNILTSLNQMSDIINIDLSAYPNGLYLVMLENGSVRVTKKLLIQK